MIKTETNEKEKKQQSVQVCQEPGVFPGKTDQVRTRYQFRYKHILLIELTERKRIKHTQINK